MNLSDEETAELVEKLSTMFILRDNNGEPLPLTLDYVLRRAKEVNMVFPFKEFMGLEINDNLEDISGPFSATRKELWKKWNESDPYKWEVTRLFLLYKQGIWPVLTSQMG